MPVAPVMVRPENAACRFRVVPLVETVQPFCQPPLAGETLTLALRLMASLRARAREEKRSKEAVLTRCPSTNELKAGRARPARIPAIAIVTISSTRVNPEAAARRFALVSDERWMEWMAMVFSYQQESTVPVPLMPLVPD